MGIAQVKVPYLRNISDFELTRILKMMPKQELINIDMDVKVVLELNAPDIDPSCRR